MVPDAYLCELRLESWVVTRQLPLNPVVVAHRERTKLVDPTRDRVTDTGRLVEVHRFLRATTLFRARSVKYALRNDCADCSTCCSVASGPRRSRAWTTNLRSRASRAGAVRARRSRVAAHERCALMRAWSGSSGIQVRCASVDRSAVGRQRCTRTRRITRSQTDGRKIKYFVVNGPHRARSRPGFLQVSIGLLEVWTRSALNWEFRNVSAGRELARRSFRR